MSSKEVCRTCSRCSKTVRDAETICPHCGFALQQGNDAGTAMTLDGMTGLESLLAKHPTTLQEDANATIDLSASQSQGVSAAKFDGTLPTINASALESKADSADAATMESQPFSLPDGPQQAPSPQGTMLLRPGKPGTIGYDSAELRDAIGLGTGRSNDKLQKLWHDAVGSSNKGTRQSLRHGYAEASDSIFRRVAMRNIAEIDTQEPELCDYRMLEKLGEGGMGIVYSAVQTAVDRVVAIKSIRAEKRNKESLKKQFFYEAEITADLDHPNIPPIYELGTTGKGDLFYSMKLIKGMEWQKVLKSNSREINLDVFQKVCDAIGFAHSRNIIHRDLKPDNTMIGTYGEVYVTDWGLAVRIDRKGKYDFGGTPDYMAPEMASNKPDLIGKHSDVYLLGAILYQVLTGTPPHKGKTAMDRLASAMRNDIAEAECDDPLVAVALKAMAGPIEDRYQTVEDLQAAIREVRDHEESITLTQRADEIVKRAIERQDYDQFNRAIYGFREAIELWGNNHRATKGLQLARLAFGQCALEKRDFDLALQTLDTTVEQERELHTMAYHAKLQTESRLRRFQSLMRAFFVMVVLFSVVSLGLAGYAWNRSLVADRNAKVAKEEAIRANSNEVIAKKNEETAKEEAKRANDNEQLARVEASRANQNAKIASDNETKAIQEAQRANENEAIAKTNEQKARDEAFRANENEQRATQRAAQIILNERIAKTSLANVRVEKSDLVGAQQLIESIQNTDRAIFGADTPLWNSWAQKRVTLLAHADIPFVSIPGKVTTSSVARNDQPGKILAAVGTHSQGLAILTRDGDSLKRDQTIPSDEPIRQVAVAPDGDEVVYLSGEKALVWRPTWQRSKVIDVIQGRSFQCVSYSSDGKTVILGVNEGLWGWNRSGDWYETPPTVQLRNVRGTLQSIHWIQPTQFLALSRIADLPAIHHVDIDKKTSSTVELSHFPLSKLTAIGTMDDIVIFCGQDGGMVSSRFSPKSGQFEDPVVLPSQNQSSIHSVVLMDKNRLATLSSEALTHIWKRDERSDSFVYESFLTGVPSRRDFTPNLVWMGMASQGDLLFVDSSDNAFLTNRLDQLMRQRVDRQSQGTALEDSSHVVGVFPQGNTNRVVTVHADGVVDVWNRITGETERAKGGNTWSFVGHTPGAVLVDTAISDAGFVLTSANLKNADKRYLQDANEVYEFCLWDQNTKNMIGRWTETSLEAIEPRLSLLNGGREWLVASDRRTRIVDKSGSVIFDNDAFGTSFAVQHPIDQKLVALVKRSGAIWVWDRSKPEESWGQWPRVFSPVIEDGIPLKGIWNRQGNRFYLAFNNGAVVAYTWNGISLRQESHSGPARFRVLSHNELDLGLLEADETETLTMAARQGNPQFAHHTLVAETTFRTIANSIQFSGTKERSEQGMIWLAGERNPVLLNEPSDSYRLNLRSGDRILARTERKNFVYVSTQQGRVLRIDEETQRLTSYGRLGLVDSTSNREADRVWTLHADGSLWLLRLSEEGAEDWQRVEFDLKGATKISSSPDGTVMTAYNKETRNLRVISASDGSEVSFHQDIVAHAWDPHLERTLVCMTSSGELSLLQDGQSEKLPKFELSGHQIVSLKFFGEFWEEEKRAPTRYIIVHSESETLGAISWIPLAKEQQGSVWVKEIRKGMQVTVSPKDSTLVMGDEAGTISVWSAIRRWDIFGQLFEIEGHRGASLGPLVFSHDGETLITADRNRRLYGWRAK